jgi:hypothetical protein
LKISAEKGLNRHCKESQEITSPKYETKQKKLAPIMRNNTWVISDPTASIPCLGLRIASRIIEATNLSE